MSRNDSTKTLRTWLEKSLAVKNSSLEEILMVILAQLEGGFERVHEGFGYDEQNQEREYILNFAIVYDLMIANTFFRKEKIHLITFSSVLTRREERPNIMNCMVIPGECVVTQYKLLVADFYFQVCVQRDRGMKITRMRWWKLKWDVSQDLENIVIAEGSWNKSGDADNMWKEMTTHIRKVAIKFFGVTRENKREPKNTWWWNDNVQKAINEKK
jgi:hypothetical protein